MKEINKNLPPTTEDIARFVREVDTQLPEGFIEFFSETNGAELQGIDEYVILWPLTDMIKLNQDYNVKEYAPDFFLFGSDGGDMCYCLKKKTGLIYEMPFIGMSNEEAILKSHSFKEFLEK